MKALHRMIVAALLVCLAAGGMTAHAAGLENPQRYIGTWEGGEDYGETNEYYLELLDYSDGVFTAALAIYRIWSFDNMTAFLMEDAPSAVLATSAGDEYFVLCALDFTDAAIDLTVLDSDYPDLLPDTQIRFEKSALD